MCILQRPMAFSTYLGGLKHFAGVWFYFTGADVLFTSYFLLITCYSLSMLAFAFSRQHTVNGAERCKQENLENLVSRAEAWFFSFLQAAGDSWLHGTSIYGENISLLLNYFCIRLDGITVEKHKLYTSKQEFSMKIFGFSSWKCFKKGLGFCNVNFFSRLLLHPQLSPALRSLYDHGWPW